MKLLLLVSWYFRIFVKHFLFFAAPFFQECISEEDLNEMNIEIIRNTLYKAYLESFYDWCKEKGGATADSMCEILAVSCSSI